MKALKTSICILSSILIFSSSGTIFAQTNAALEDAASFEFSPPDDGLPDNTTGGASRPTSACLMQQGTHQAANITLLAPASFVGLTVSAKPTFLLHAVQTPVEQVFINLKSVEGKLIYQGFQTLPKNTGFFAITLPEETPDLEIDGTYQLSVVPVCGSTLRPDDPVLTGYVKRIMLSSTAEQLPQAHALEIAQRYADSGVWYDTLLLLKSGLSEAPEDGALLDAWSSLLTAGGFSGSQLSDPGF